MNTAAPVQRRPPLPASLRGAGEGPKKRRAQSLVEFAMVLPILFILTMGIIEFGWLFRNYMTVHYSTREGARVGAVDGDAGSADNDILQAISTSMQTMPYNDLLSVKIFKQEPDSACDPSCTLNSYTRDATGWQFDPSSNWATGDRRTQEPTDPLAVEIQFRHRFLVNIIPGAIGTIIIRDFSVVQIEPASFATPGPGH